MRVRLQPHGSDGEAFLPLPPELLEAAGMKEGDLVEVNPHVRSIDGVKVETVVIIKKLRQ